MRILACLLIVFSPTLFAALVSHHEPPAPQPVPALEAPAPEPPEPDAQKTTPQKPEDSNPLAEPAQNA
jgi:hypothetical protein